MTLGISDEEFENAIDQAARRRCIDLAHASEFTVGPVRVVPSLRTIMGPEGEEVLEPKVMQVLIALNDGLTETGGDILSRDDLIERCWEGRVVGESSINRVISLLRSALKSVCGETVKVENVPKVGYRLLLAPDWEPAPVEEAGASTQAQVTETPDTGKERAGSIVLAAGLAALLAIFAAAYAFWPSASTAPVERLKVAMLPLKAGEGVDRLYARGLEAELRSQLARVGRLEVTSSESARQLFDQGLSADEICRRLGADYAWVGSLDVEADRVTLSARLIEAATKADVFQDTLSSSPDAAQSLPLRTARAITTSLGRPVSQRLSQTPVSASDFSLYLTALGLIRTRGDEQRLAALDILEQVTAQNPRFADGWAGLAKAWFLLPEMDKDEVRANRERAGEFARQALSLDPESVDALKVLGMLDSTAPDERLRLLQRATELDPGDSEAWFWRSRTQEDNPLLAVDPVESAGRVVDIDPLWPASWMSSNVAAQFGRSDEARSMERSIALAAVTPSQRLMAQARLAQLDGDLSRFIALNREAQTTQTVPERRFGSKVPLYFVERLLELPRTEVYEDPEMMDDALVARAYAGELASRSELSAAGFGGAQYWANEKLVHRSMALFLRDGREAELIEYYDAAFTRNADYLAHAQLEDSEHTFIPSVSPYLALAFRRLGREADARWHIERTREQVARWREADTGSINAVIYDLALAAIDGNNARAITLTQSLSGFGWPYTMAHVDPAAIALLTEDPLYDTVRALTGVRAVIDPIRANLAKEREEVLALGV